MTLQEILDWPCHFEDTDATSIREYFQNLLTTLWVEGEGFSGKRPFGNSDWEYDIYKPLVDMGVINGYQVGEYSQIEGVDEYSANVLIYDLIKECFKPVQMSSSTKIEQFFLNTKAIFEDQAVIAMDKVMDKMYEDYLPHVSTDTEMNVMMRVGDVLERFFEDRLREDEIKLPIFQSYTGREARKKAMEENFDHIKELYVQDLEAKIKSLENTVDYFQRTSRY